MEIELKIKLKLSDECKFLSDGELGQILFDSYINYVTVCHLRDASKWCSKGKIGSDNEDESAKILMDYHNNWADISDQPEWKIIRD